MVRENELSEPGRIGEDDYRKFVDAGSGWVAEHNERLLGFAIIDQAAASVWALFVDPEFEGIGVGSALHDHMTGWARGRQITKLSLTTGPDTRAFR
ncbi:MAG: GNAT family N-acetyltransferase, partial [Sphingomicrobium sp.]